MITEQDMKTIETISYLVEDLKHAIKERKNKVLPMRQIRFCCTNLKENHGNGRTVLTGVRHEESPRRAKRKIQEVCTSHTKKSYLHPIIDWTAKEKMKVNFALL